MIKLLRLYKYFYILLYISKLDYIYRVNTFALIYDNMDIYIKNTNIANPKLIYIYTNNDYPMS